MPKGDRFQAMEKQSTWINRVRKLRNLGVTNKQIASRLGISLSSVQKIMRAIKSQVQGS